MELEMCPHLSQNVTKSLQGRVIYKDQCNKCFADPFDPAGLNVCLYCFQGGCISNENHAKDHFEKSQHCISLNIKMKLVVEESNQQQQEITKIAIGKEGGALDKKERLETEYSVYCYLCNKDVEPKSIDGVLKSIQNTNSSFAQDQVVAWELDIFPCEHSLILEQIPKTLTPEHLAHCSNCELSKNLWLCLTCGNIGCGRKQYDGSGGNNHGIDHFQSTKHPLSVKMGTITADGNASIYCYQCDTEVKDDHISSHLINFGLDVRTQTKTEKTMTELNIQANLSLTLSSLIEDGKSLTPLFGPYNTGLTNIGNSCYLNAIYQVLFQLPEFQQKYFLDGQKHLRDCDRFTPNCFYCQFSKLGVGLCSGQYSVKKEHQFTGNQSNQVLAESQKFYQDGIKIYDLKAMVAKGNKEFQSNRMQDSLEYLQHLFDFLRKSEKQFGLGDSTAPFQFAQVTKLRCLQCGLVKLQENKNNELKLPVRHPTTQELEKAAQEKKLRREQQLREKQAKTQVNEEESTINLEIDLDFEGPIYNTDFKQSIESYRNGTSVDLDCPNCGKNKEFVKFEYLKSTPKYLLVAMNRFVVVNWVPKKLNAMIDVPSQIDLSDIVYPGLLEGETLYEEKQENKVESQPHIDPIALQNLMEAGFSENRCKRALIAKDNNAELAMNWIFENMDDPRLDSPLEFGNKEKLQVNPENIQTVASMGFSEIAARYALSKCSDNIERAIEFLFSRENVEEEALSALSSQPDKEKMEEEVQDSNQQAVTSTNYSLKAAIIHLGTTATSGHYVSYVKRDGAWILFNDSKVAIQDDPVLGKGYFYLFERQ